MFSNAQRNLLQVYANTATQNYFKFWNTNTRVQTQLRKNDWSLQNSERPIRYSSDWRIFYIQRKRHKKKPFQDCDQENTITARQKFFRVAAINDWISLPETLISSESVQVFKSRPDKLWASEIFDASFLEWPNGRPRKSWSTEAWEADRSKVNLWTSEALLQWKAANTNNCQLRFLRLF